MNSRSENRWIIIVFSKWRLCICKIIRWKFCFIVNGENMICIFKCNVCWKSDVKVRIYRYKWSNGFKI